MCHLTLVAPVRGDYLLHALQLGSMILFLAFTQPPFKDAATSLDSLCMDVAYKAMQIHIYVM